MCLWSFIPGKIPRQIGNILASIFRVLVALFWSGCKYIYPMDRDQYYGIISYIT